MLDLRTPQQTSILLMENLWRYGSPFQGLGPDHETAGTQAAWLGLVEIGPSALQTKKVSHQSHLSPLNVLA
jgi:hypothetical protein